MAGHLLHAPNFGQAHKGRAGLNLFKYAESPCNLGIVEQLIKLSKSVEKGLTHLIDKNQKFQKQEQKQSQNLAN